MQTRLYRDVRLRDGTVLPKGAVAEVRPLTDHACAAEGGRNLRGSWPRRPI